LTGRFKVLLAVLGLLLFYINFALNAKRFHDRDKSFLWNLLILGIILLDMVLLKQRMGVLSSTLISLGVLTGYIVELGFFVIINVALLKQQTGVLLGTLLSLVVLIWYIVELGVMPGDEGANFFGEDPRKDTAA
jgi:uncharacterized membrane protein YhaH (DUF805 family)